MIVHWPSGRRTRIKPEDAAAAVVVGDLCPRSDEHTALPPRAVIRRYDVTIHPPCGMPVIWTRRIR